MNNKLRIKRLKQLKHMVDNWPKIFKRRLKLFMGTYMETSLRGKKQCCVLGAAATYRPFKQQGLSLFGGKYPTYRNNICIDAARAFFGITLQEANRTFGGQNMIKTRKEVAADIGKLIDHYS